MKTLVSIAILFPVIGGVWGKSLEEEEVSVPILTKPDEISSNQG